MGNLRLSRAAFLVALVVTQEIQSKATVQGKPIATKATTTKSQWKPLEGDKPAGP